MVEGWCISIAVPVKQRASQRRSAQMVTTSPTPLQCAVARAYSWRRLLDDARYHGIHALAADVGCDPSYVARVLNLALLAPDLVKAIMEGESLANIPLTHIPKALPLAWCEQIILFQTLAEGVGPGSSGDH